KLVRDIRHIEAAMGSPDKRVADSELSVRVRLGKSVVAARHIPAGTILTAEMLTAKSPGDGISANHLDELIGRVACAEVFADTLLPADALSWQFCRGESRPTSEKTSHDGVASRA
ncbi:MAG TPA: SAF domain-containing protein, partial [Mycobacteriales bacterium]|nr:SAF domain-containing protein [Mycobacteriales bacterium]